MQYLSINREHFKPGGKVENHFYLLVFVLFTATGCIPDSTVHKPPVTRTSAEHYQIGKFVWHDLLTQDTTEAKRFYGGLFGWRFRKDESHGEDSHIINRGKVIGSIRSDIENSRGESSTIWLSALSVANVEEALETVLEFGGEVYAGPGRLSDRGRFAIISDPQGAALMLLHTISGDPADTKALAGDWLWMELWTRDIDNAVKFYKTLVAYQIVREPGDKGAGYQRFQQNNVTRAGVVELPSEQVQPNWLPYVRVLDVRQTVQQAEQLGGRIIVEPDPELKQGGIAVIADPTGGVLAVQELRNR